MAGALDISIPTTSASTSTDPKAYTIYHISLRQPLRKHTIPKRYSDFTNLHTAISSQSSNVPPPCPLPQKSWFKSTLSSPELTESRRRGLEQYLRAINDAKDPRWRSSSAWRIFLSLPNSGAGGLGVAHHAALQSSRVGDSSNPISDPSVWLDVHRDLKAQLRDARQALSQRDQAAEPHAQHEASANAKGYLTRARLTITSLETGLRSMSRGGDIRKAIRGNTRNEEQDNGSVKLGEGELRRRNDMLLAARRERDQLEESSNTATPGRRAREDESQASKDELFQGAGGTAAKSGRRVLGGPLKETERTRELDNSGVLQLQKQIMEEQDEDVVDLTRVVHRMKEMGIQVNDEIQAQNEMLTMLDQDVDRVGDKVNVAKKRVKKID